MKINKYIDHTLLKATATASEIELLCKEALEYDFFSVCVNSSYVPLVSSLVKNSPVKVCSVVGFPLGAMSAKAKIFEANQTLEDGADEVDMVINLGDLKSCEYQKVQKEIEAIKQACGSRTLKVIIETCYLTDNEKDTVCKLAVNAGADFVKTSTGFGTGGATPQDILLMKNATQGKTKIKASGGIRDYKTAMEYIELGVHRIGTSNGIAIVMQNNSNSDKNY